MSKIGVFVPTHGRPDLIRFCLLQLMAQSLLPRIVVVHQNGNKESYQHVVDDMDWPFEIEWMFNPNQLRQHEWYERPLKRLVELDCDFYFWVDHDDIYSSRHVEISTKELEEYDFRVSLISHVLTVDQRKYDFKPKSKFKCHGPGGQSSSMAFNKRFAECLLADMEKHGHEHFYTDNIVSKITIPKFRCLRSDQCTTTYVCHRGSLTSWAWVDKNII